MGEVVTVFPIGEEMGMRFPFWEETGKSDPFDAGVGEEDVVAGLPETDAEFPEVCMVGSNQEIGFHQEAKTTEGIINTAKNKIEKYFFIH